MHLLNQCGVDGMQSSPSIVQVKAGHLEFGNVGRQLCKVFGMAIDKIPALQVQTSLVFEECCTHDAHDTCVSDCKIRRQTLITPLKITSHCQPDIGLLS